jgi:hypothetical protein
MSKRNKSLLLIVLSFILSVTVFFLFVLPRFEHEKIAVVLSSPQNIIQVDTNFKRQTDSLLILQYYRNGILYDGFLSPVGSLEKRAFLNEEAIKIEMPGSLSTPDSKLAAVTDSLAFFAFDGLTFSSTSNGTDDANVYFIKNRQPYIAIGRNVKKSPFFYDEEADSIMLPLNTTAYTVIKSVLIVLMIILVLLLTTVSSGGVVRLMAEISKGNTFTPVNILILKTLKYLFLLAPLLYCFTHLICYWVLKNLHPDIIIKSEVFYTTGKLMFIGFFFLTLHYSFKKGYLLQQESEFTV